MNDVMNAAESCKRLNNLLKNVFENFKSDDERFKNVNRERFRVVDRCKFDVIDDFCRFCSLTDKCLNVIVIARLNVMHVKFIVIQTIIDLCVRRSFQHYIKFRLIERLNCIIENFDARIDAAFKNNENLLRSFLRSLLRSLLRNFIIVDVDNLSHCLS